MALTFMAKSTQREGNSCHIHFSLRGADGALVMAATADGMSDARASTFVAGQLTHMRELTLLLAPNINSYKRYRRGLVRADRAALGPGQPHLRVRLVGHGASLRLENRVPGGDVNPYLATAALVAAGAARASRSELELEPAFEGNAYDDPARRAVPTTPARGAGPVARQRLRARRTFGDDVVDHYANMAAVELAAFDAAVTDWERFRGFERL